MCSARCLTVLYICEKFHQNIWNGLKTTEWTQVHGRNGYVQCSKGNNSKVGKPELWFMGSACRLIEHYICVKFCENILNGFQLTERTWVHGRNGYVQCSKGNNSKSRQTRVTVHMLCLSSHSDLHLCEVMWKYLRQYLSYVADTNDGRADGRTDGRMVTQNFGWYNIIPSPLFVSGHKKNKYVLWGNKNKTRLSYILFCTFFTIANLF